MLYFNLVHAGRIFIWVSLLFAICCPLVYAQASLAEDSNEGTVIVTSGFFKCPEPLYITPLLSGSQAYHYTGTIPSQLLPLVPEDLSSQEFEQIQSIVIPGGILDTVNKIIFLEDNNDQIKALDLNTGKLIQEIHNVCTPVAVVDNCLIAFSKTGDNAKYCYDLVLLDDTTPQTFKARWHQIPLPDWLDLPVDGERQKFVFNAHCYNGTLSIAWQANQKSLLPNALSLFIPGLFQTGALQGEFSCELKSLAPVAQSSIKESNNDFSSYLTENESSLPAQIAFSPEAIAIKKYDHYVLVLTRSYPPENNISKAGVVGKRELEVVDAQTGKILWTHTLPAAFIPISF